MGEESVMGGVVYATPYASAIDNSMLNQAAANMQSQMFAANQAMAYQQAAMNQAVQQGSLRDIPVGSLLNSGPRGVDTTSVPKTAASRVQKADWEMEYDRKEREVDEMIERQRQERERVRIEEESGNDPRGED